ncbi:MAG: toxin-antitoxin system HicB family antitoxin [Calothrix sp. SM1_5_4]|nr:toxin-antitoxin system HicB family antitoxin [Calothrix sp. SM1_5_4]
MKHDGEVIPDPIGSRKFPTSFPLRLPEDVRRELELEAAEHSMSLNQWITKKFGSSDFLVPTEGRDQASHSRTG